MTKNNIKVILLASLMVAMILPFSVMSMADAAPNENAKEKAEKKAKEKAEKRSKFKNHDADLIMKELAPYIISEDGKPKNLSAKDLKEKKKLQDKLAKSQEKHKEKIIDKELRKDLKKALKLFRATDIPTTMTAAGIDHVYIKLAEPNPEYEKRIAELMGNIPYKIDYGEGPKRASCDSTQTVCDPKRGGIAITIDNPGTNDKNCSLSIPMKKDNIPGYLTAAHCFTTGGALVYQPDMSTSDNFIGLSYEENRSYENNGECDCAWIEEGLNIVQANGVFVFPQAYWNIVGTVEPQTGDQAMYRGQHSTNGLWYESDVILHDDIEINTGGHITKNAMSFPSSVQEGDSGGSVFYNGHYMGIIVAGGHVDGVESVIFIPWQHITENLSGLTL